MVKCFGQEDCEVSDDQITWRSAVGNVGRYGRVKPDVWDAFAAGVSGKQIIPLLSIGAFGPETKL